MLKKCLRISLHKSLSSAWKFWIRADLLRNPVFCTCLSLSYSRWQSSFWAALPNESPMLVERVGQLNNLLCSASDPQDFDRFFWIWPAFYFIYLYSSKTPGINIKILDFHSPYIPNLEKRMYHPYSFCLVIQKQRTVAAEVIFLLGC